MKQTLLRRLRQGLDALPCCLFFALAVTVFPAVQLVRENAEEFWFTPWQMLPGMAAVFALLALVLFAAAALLPRKASGALAAVLAAFGVMALLQGNGLNADYGELNGKAIDWGKLTVYGVLNTVEWLGAAFVCVSFRETRWGKRLLVVLPCVAVLVLGGLTGFWLSETPKETQGEQVLTTAGLDTLGTERNLVVLIPDSVDAAMLSQALAEDPEVGALLDGFTFYENAMGLSDPTKFGIPALLTGRVYDTATDYAGFIKAACTDAALFDAAQAGGWDARLYTDKRYVDLPAAAPANAQTQQLTVSDDRALTRDLWQVCAFRFAPHFLKPMLWMYGNVFDQYAATTGDAVYVENDEAYYAQLAQSGLQAVPGKTLRVIHLTGMHPPYTMDAQCQYQGGGVTAQEQMQGCLRLLGAYLSEIDRLGLRDVTDVLILADHGTEQVHRPMLLLRRAGETGPLRTSGAPVSYADLPATYTALLTGDETGALWTIPEGAARTRLYYHEDSRNDDFNYIQYATDSLDPAWEDLRETGVVYHGDTAGEPSPYVLGTTLYFDLRATARKYLVSGFSSADFLSTWTSGDTGEMALPLAAQPAQDHLTVALSFLSVMQGSQRLVVECGGQTVFDETVTGSAVRFTVPSACAADGTLTLHFTYPDAISHKDAGLSDDTRRVAFAVTELTVRDGD